MAKSKEALEAASTEDSELEQAEQASVAKIRNELEQARRWLERPRFDWHAQIKISSDGSADISVGSGGRGILGGCECPCCCPR